MALKLRIDSVTHDNGAVSISYTAGYGDLPANPSGAGMGFASADDLRAALENAENTVSEEMLLLGLMSFAYKMDQTLMDCSAAEGKTIYLTFQAGPKMAEVV